MKIDHTYYVIDAKAPLNASSSSKLRRGALLRVEFNSTELGYADCHPWPELGDYTIEKQLQELRQRKFSTLTRRALEWALIDAKGRAEGKSLLEEKAIPSSHLLISYFLDWTSNRVEQIINDGFTHVKLKMGRHLYEEAEQLIALFAQTSLKLRLDFNERLTKGELIDFLALIGCLKGHIDYIEDPIPFHAADWKIFQQQGWTLACDRCVVQAFGQAEAASVLVIKPAIHGPDVYLKRTPQRKVITTNGGHPLEQMAAAYATVQMDPLQNEVHGLLSHHVYLSNSFSSQFNWKGPQFSLPAGNGFGFDEQLISLPWESLS